MSQNPNNLDAQNTCQSFMNSLGEMVRDFDTLIQYAEQNLKRKSNVNTQIIQASLTTRNKLINLIDKLHNI